MLLDLPAKEITTLSSFLLGQPTNDQLRATLVFADLSAKHDPQCPAKGSQTGIEMDDSEEPKVFRETRAEWAEVISNTLPPNAADENRVVFVELSLGWAAKAVRVGQMLAG